jgi:hypothetical protein
MTTWTHRMSFTDTQPGPNEPDPWREPIEPPRPDEAPQEQFPSREPVEYPIHPDIPEQPIHEPTPERTIA